MYGLLRHSRRGSDEVSTFPSSSVLSSPCVSGPSSYACSSVLAGVVAPPFLPSGVTASEWKHCQRASGNPPLASQTSYTGKYGVAIGLKTHFS